MKRLSTAALATLVLLSCAACAGQEAENTTPSGEASTGLFAMDTYAEAVMYCREHGLMDGVGNNRFAPESSLTRAQLATVSPGVI